MPGRDKIKVAATAGGLGLTAVAVVQLGAWLAGSMALVTSWASSAALISVLFSSPAARPKPVFLGHVLSALVGVGAVLAAGDAAWMAAVSVGIAIAVMVLVDAFHPPAAANAAIPFVQMPSIDGYLLSVVLGAVLLALFSILLNRKAAHRAD